MHRQPDVLQKRVKIRAIQRRRENPLERIGCKEHEAQETDTNPGLNR